jgi:hypothetical protein
MAENQTHGTRVRQTTKREMTESSTIEASELPIVKNLDGEVTRQGDFAFAEGSYCEIWVGSWEKVGKEVGREKVYGQH